MPTIEINKVYILSFNMSSFRYRREFVTWLNDFKKTDTYTDIVDGYEKCWSEIYKELHRRFKENIWNPSKLANGFHENDISINEQRNSCEEFY